MSNYYNRQWRLPNSWNGTESNVNKQSNYSMDFDGTNYIDLGDSVPPFNQTTSKFSISFWLNRENTTTNKCVFENRGSSLDSGISLEIRPGNTVFYFWIYPSTGGGTITTFPISSVAINQWNHIAIVFDGTQTGNTNRLKIYVNNTSLTLTYLHNVPSDVGGSGTGDNFRLAEGLQANFQGKMDAFSMFNYPLSSSQVTTLYGSSSTGIGNPMSLNPKPVAYYPLGDQDSFNGAEYLTPNASLKDYVFFVDNVFQSTSTNGITMGSYSDTAGLSAVSWSLWINLQVLNSASGYSRILNSDSFFFATNASNGGQNWTFAFVTVNGTISKNFTLSTALQNQGWVNIIGTYDGTNTKFYLNTVQQGTQGSGSGVLNTTSSLNLGYFYGSNSVDAYFSNFSIWNKALSTSDISEIYNSGSPSNLSSHSSTSNLINWWKLDASDTYDGTNWNFEDHAGSSNATSSGMTQANLVQSDLSFTSGYSPYALAFDGSSSSRVEISNLHTFFNGNNIFSISCWVKRTTNTGTFVCAWGMQGGGAQALYALASGASLRVERGFTTDVYISDFFPLNEWVNLTTVFDSSTNVKVYKNGSFVQDVTVSATATYASNIKFYIGNGINAGYGLYGNVSNLAIWNSALTSTQVSEIYNEGVPSNLNNHSAYSNLLSWWQLGSNSSFNTNWTVLDEKGSNNGTSVNMTEADIVDGVGSSANGLSSGMSDNIVGSAPFSDANSLSVNMDVLDRTEDTPA